LKFGQDVPAVLDGKGKNAKVLTPEFIAPLVKDRLAELIYRNGGEFRIGGWGVKQLGGIYGSIGLDAADAFDLMHLSGILIGFALAADISRWQVQEDIMEAIKNIWRTMGWTDE
jgi:hypothetical protein